MKEADQSERLKSESAYRDLREQHYRFYQFYGNTFLVLIFGFMAWVYLSRPGLGNFLAVGAFFAVVEAILFFSAKNSLETFRIKARSLLGLDDLAA